MYSREDWTLFRSLETLAQQSGVPARMLAQLVAKELADNALDIAGQCEYGKAGADGFYIADHGEGIPGDDEDIARLFSINRPLTSSKLLRLPMRGALGNGLRVVAGAVLAARGTLQVSTRGRTLRLIPQDDGTTGAENIGAFDEAGTRIEVHLGVEAGRVDLGWVDLAVLMSSGGASYKGNTSPFWYDADAFFELTQAAGDRSVRDLIASFDGCTGKRAGEIATDFKNRPANTLTREEALDLLCAARQNAKPVSPDRLGAVGGIDGLPGNPVRVVGTHTIKAVSGSLSAELPYVLEVWAGYDDTTDSRPDVHVCVNRTPITGRVTSSHEKKQLALSGCGLNHLLCKSSANLPHLWINITTPFMPITNHGKLPDLLLFLKDIAIAVEKSVGRAKRNSAALTKTERVSEKSVILDNLAEACENAGGSSGFSQRQAFYSIRPFVEEALGKEASWSNFTSVIAAYENKHGDIEHMYRDTRGVLYHPHSQQEIALGTLSVKAYTRPTWTFNKILYIEKQGFFSILKDVKWPERHDCALLTAKGFATKAARDVIDLLGETDEEICFYCIHDADASGTLIYQALQEATKARPARRVKVINLGLEPEEGLKMGLKPENFKREKPSPVAEYVPQKWKDWLQTQRIELNAMNTPLFLEWLDSKFEEQPGKVIPPTDVMAEHFEDQVEDCLRDAITLKLLEEGRLEERVSEAIQNLQPAIQERLGELEEDVRGALAETPEHPWKHPVNEIAEHLASSVDLSGGEEDNPPEQEENHEAQ